MRRAIKSLYLPLVVVCIAATSPHPDPRETRDRTKTMSVGDSATRSPGSLRPILPAPAAKTKPCLPGDEDRSRELCAEWKSADEAHEAAKWAARSFYVALVGFLGLVITLGFNFIAWRQAKDSRGDTERALKQAERSAAAMERTASAMGRAGVAASEANALARETQQRELRPHLYILPITADISVQGAWGDHPNFFAKLILEVRNFGLTPAHAVTFRGRCFLGGYWSTPFNADLEEAAVVPLGSVPPNVDTRIGPYTATIIPPDMQLVENGVKSIFVEGQLQYTDAFGNQYFTNLRRACTEQDRNAGTFHPCPDWNEAT